MNTYPTTAEKLFLEQKERDDNNPGILEYRRSEARWRNFRPLTEQQKKKSKRTS